MKSNRQIRMVLASSSELFLEGIHKILEEEDNIEIVAEASNPKEVEKCITQIKPKFLFLDNRTLDLDIRKLLNLINKKSYGTKVILFDDYNSEDVFTFPSVIHITRETNSLELIHTIKSLNKGVLTKEANGVDSTKHKFTNMEVKIIELIVGGFSNKEIAKELSTSEKNVKAHLTRIFMKLGLQNRYQLIVYARQLKRK